MTKTTKPVQYDWIIPTLAIGLALTLALGIGFLGGQQAPSASDSMSAICRHLPQKAASADCIALRSAVATEGATSIAGWALWVSFSSLVASAFALIGLIIAYIQGQRTISLAIDGNRIAMENGQTQSRAYVVVQSVECQLSEHGQLTTRVRFQNSGLSPARRLRWLYNAHLVVVLGENEQRSLLLSDEPDLEKSHWRRDIPSADSWTSAPLALRQPNDPEVSALIKQAVSFAVTVKIVADYQDVFGVTHREIACFQGLVDPGQVDARFAELERAQDGVFDELAKHMET